jgi:hypothetical protein
MQAAEVDRSENQLWPDEDDVRAIQPLDPDPGPLWGKWRARQDSNLRPSA